MTPRHRAATADGGDRDGGCGRRDGRHEGTEEEAPLELAAAVAIALARWRIHSAGGSLDASLDVSLDVPAGTLAGDVTASVAPVAFLLFRRLVAGMTATAPIEVVTARGIDSVLAVEGASRGVRNHQPPRAAGLCPRPSGWPRRGGRHGPDEVVALAERLPPRVRQARRCEGVPMPVALAIIVVAYGAAERATLLGQVT